MASERYANFKGNKNSGRKSNAEYIESFKEQVKAEALIELSNRIISKRLKMLDESKGIAYVNLEKEFALPIALRGITEKKEITGDLTMHSILNEIEGNNK